MKNIIRLGDGAWHSRGENFFFFFSSRRLLHSRYLVMCFATGCLHRYSFKIKFNIITLTSIDDYDFRGARFSVIFVKIGKDFHSLLNRKTFTLNTQIYRPAYMFRRKGANNKESGRTFENCFEKIPKRFRNY